MTPTIFVLFGAMGDLAERKIIPSLFKLYNKGLLPELFTLVGVSRRNVSDEAFQDKVRSYLKEGDVDGFVKKLRFVSGDATEKSGFNDLAEVLGKVDGEWKACSNKLFHLSIAPELYEASFHALSDSGLCEPCGEKGEGWTRVIIEKPFGEDLKTAEKLDSMLGDLFKEEQIYRIDHYLGKEMIRNILAFRFANNLLEKNWNNESVEKIEVKLLESLDVTERGAFYDSTGALRDMGQNHLLQILALVAMDEPDSFDSADICKRRVELFESLNVVDTERGQYEGYLEVDGVKDSSNTETYFKLNCEISSDRWKGVPVLLESGKKMGKESKEVVVTFKKTHLGDGNKVVFRLGDDEGISISFWSKKLGLDMGLKEEVFDFCYSCDEGGKNYSESYEKLILDCVEGNQMLFVSTEEVRLMWGIIDPIIESWEASEVPLDIY